MSIKSDLLKQIDKKAQSIKDKRNSSINKNTPENYVFEFFKNMDDVQRMSSTPEDWHILATAAYNNLIKEIRRGIDPLCTLDITWDKHYPQGVTIHWSAIYQVKNNVATDYYIDIGQMLLST